MMRVCGSRAKRQVAQVFVFLAVLAGAAAAAETLIVAVPVGQSYEVSAVLVPGLGGAEVVGGDMGDKHVDFRIGFAEGTLSVNGVDGGPFDPEAVYLVDIACHQVGCAWFATTRIINMATGVTVYEQANYRLPSAAAQVWATAADVVGLSIS